MAKLVIPRVLQGLHFGLACIGLHEADDDRPGFQPLNLLDREGLYGQHHVCLLEHGSRRIRPGHVLVS